MQIVSSCTAVLEVTSSTSSSYSVDRALAVRKKSSSAFMRQRPPLSQCLCWLLTETAVSLASVTAASYSVALLFSGTILIAFASLTVVAAVVVVVAAAVGSGDV
jgi:hypothetical protein